MKFTYMILIFLLCSCTTNSEIKEESSTYVEESKFEQDLIQYRQFKARKAYALAMDDSGEWASGYAHDYPTQEMADEEALLKCNERRLLENIQSKCEIYMQGNTKI